MAQTGFSIEMNKGEMLKAEAMLLGVKNGFPKVTARAVNKSLTGAKTEAVKAVSEEITATKTAIRKTFRTYRASVAKPSGKVESKQAYGIPLISFKHASAKREGGVKVQVYHSKKRKLYKSSFIARMPSGHKGIFERLEKFRKGKPVRKIPYGVLPKKYRLPIRELRGPTVPMIMSEDKVMAVIEKAAGARFQKNFTHELDRELSKL